MSNLFHVYMWRRPMHVHLLGRCIRRRFATENRKAILPTPWRFDRVAHVHGVPG